MTRMPVTLAALLLLAPPAWAVKTQHFTQTSAADFKGGTATNVVITSTGRLRLGRQVEAMLPNDRHFDAIQAVIEAPDGAIVFSSFPDGGVSRLKDGKLTTLAAFKDQTVTALAYDAKGRLLIGVGGEQAKLMRVARPGDAAETVCEPKDVKYIWSIVPDGDAAFLATGPGGLIVKVDAAGTAETFAELDGENVTALTSDKASLYAGTDGGLVYKIARDSGKPFVLYEAAEAEISALAWDDHGNLLAATSDPPGGDVEAAMPAVESAQPSASGELPGKMPTPPKPPEKKPGDAIPRATTAGNAPATTPSKAPAPAVTPSANGGPATNEASANGNAVYRIDPDGQVTELWRKSAIIYGLVVHGDRIIVSTGDDGEVIELDPDSGEATTLLRTEAPDATGLLAARDGTLYVSTSNAGQIVKLTAGLAAHGTFESDVLDAGVPSAFGQLHLLGTTPGGTTLTVQTRVGNISDPESAGWGDWSAAASAKAFQPVAGPTGRFVQYRLTFDTTDTTDAAKSATADEVDIAYQRPNLPPRIAAVLVAPGDGAGQMNVAWDATDGNDDELRYDLFVRQLGDAAWMRVGENLTEPAHTWNAKGVADGEYEIKVVASDVRANPPGVGREISRVSDAVLIDNTPPAVGDVKTILKDGAATVTFRAVDRGGTIASVETSVDQVDHWQKRLPDDTIADSPEERYTVSLDGLGSGSHTLLIRATDSRGNASYETTAVTVP